MQIRFKEKDFCDYYLLKILTPKLWLNTDLKRPGGGGFNIEFNTGFHFNYDPEISWEINFKVLGFGLSLFRQFSY